LVDLLSFSPAKHVLFLLDTQEGLTGVAIRQSALSLNPDVSDPLDRLERLPSRQVLVASESPELAGGFFSYHLIDALSGYADVNADGVTTATELAVYLMVAVPKASEGKQHPRFGWLSGEGEFLFEHRSSPSAGK
jgi:uncharacterized caspase-like protein